MAKIAWLPAAISDLNDIFEYIAKDSPYHANRTVERILAKTDLLENHIYAGRMVPEFNDATVRELLENPYRKVYKVESDHQLSIVRIYHNARNIKR